MKRGSLPNLFLNVPKWNGMTAGAVVMAEEWREKGEGRRGHGGGRTEGNLRCQKDLDCFTSFTDFHIKTHSPLGFNERTFSIFPNHHGNVSCGQTVVGQTPHVIWNVFCKIEWGENRVLMVFFSFLFFFFSFFFLPSFPQFKPWKRELNF